MCHYHSLCLFKFLPLCIYVCNPDSVCRRPHTVGMMTFEYAGFKRERKVMSRWSERHGTVPFVPHIFFSPLSAGRFALSLMLQKIDGVLQTRRITEEITSTNE